MRASMRIAKRASFPGYLKSHVSEIPTNVSVATHTLTRTFPVEDEACGCGLVDPALASSPQKEW